VRVLTCAVARRRLHAFHDSELPLSQQVEMSAHLEWCDSCAAALSDLRQLRAALRVATPGRTALNGQSESGFQSAVLARAWAEQNVSFPARVRAMFDDMHLVYAGLGALAATMVCVIFMFGMMRLATTEDPDSLAATMIRLAPPALEANPIVPPAGILMPRALDDVSFVGGEAKGVDESAFTFSGVVTREGSLVNLELHSEDGQTPVAGSPQALEREYMLGAVSKVRFEPARISGLPVAVNMVWLVTQTTVHAPKGGFLQQGSGQTGVKKPRV